jgi:hypothetical protein
MKGIVFRQFQCQSYLRRNVSIKSVKSVEQEIERKFPVNESVLEFSNINAKEKKQIFLKDIYYDNDRYDLTKKDMWLRERNNSWELKAPFSPKSSSDAISGIDHYVEFKQDKDILNYINKHTNAFLSSKTPAEEVLKSKPTLTPQLLFDLGKLLPFVQLDTHRKRFSLSLPIPELGTNIYQNFHVDIDTVFYDPKYVPILPVNHPFHEKFSYTIGEIELIPPILVKNDWSDDKLMKYIFMALKIDIAPVRGKLLEYLFRYHPNHYNALKEAGQLQKKGISGNDDAGKVEKKK